MATWQPSITTGQNLSTGQAPVALFSSVSPGPPIHPVPVAGTFQAAPLPTVINAQQAVGFPIG
jgi:hypothetical protein